MRLRDLAVMVAVAIGGDVSHAEEGIQAEVILRWKAVLGAATYELHIATDSTFTNLVFKGTVQTAGYRWKGNLTRLHYWRVRSLDADSRPSLWSKTRLIHATLAPPVLTLPKDGARISSDVSMATFAFTPSPWATEHVLELAREESFVNIVTLERSHNATIRMKLPGLGMFFWRVHSIDAAGRISEPSPTRRLHVHLGRPKPVSPAPDSIVTYGETPIELRWKATPFAAQYLVEVSQGKQIIWQERAQKEQAQFVPPNAGRYRWRVTVIDSQGKHGNKSPYGSFAVSLPAPVLKTPAPDLVVRREPDTTELVFVWEPVAKAAGYTVSIGKKHSDATSVLEAKTQSTELRVTEPLADGVYRWQVAALDTSGEAGHASPPSALTLVTEEALAVPSLVSPMPDATLSLEPGSQVTLQWQVVERANRYEIELARPEVKAPARLVSSRSARWTLKTPEPGLYSWRVRARGGGQGASDWSAASSFRYTLTSGKLEVKAPAETLPWFGRFRLGVHLGWTLNFGHLSSPLPQVDLLWESPWLEHKLWCGASVGYYGTSAKIPASTKLPHTVRVNEHLLPIKITAIYAHPLGPLVVYGGGGPSLTVAFVQVGPWRQTQAAPGVHLLAGGHYELGPGVIALEIVGNLSQLETELVRTRISGMSISAGYRYALP